MAVDSQTAPMLTVRDVARILHIHINTVRRWSDEGIIRSYRTTPRGDRRFWPADITGFLSERNPGGPARFPLFGGLG